MPFDALPPAPVLGRFPAGALPPALAELVTALESGPARAVAATAEQAAVAAAAVAAALEAPLVLLTPTPVLAERVASVVRWLLHAGPTPYAFPRWPRGADSPYEEVVEGPFTAAARSGALGAFCLSEIPYAVALDAALAARRTIPFDAYSEGVFRLEVGRDIDLTALMDVLVGAGYRRTSSVAEVGEFAVRGGVVDVFSPYGEDPVRVELDGDTIASLKVFDAATQRAQRPLAMTWIVPAWEVPGDPTRLRDAVIRLRDVAAAAGVPAPRVAEVEALFRLGRTPPAFAAMLPLIYGGLDLPLDYLGETAVVAILDPAGCFASADAALDTLRAERDALAPGPRLVATPEDLAAPGETLLGRLRNRPRTLWFDSGPVAAPASGDFPPIQRRGPVLGPAHPEASSAELTLATHAEVPVADRVAGLVSIARRLTEGGQRLLVLAPSDAEADRVRSILASQGLEPAIAGRDGLAETFLLRSTTPVRVGVGRVRAPFGIETLGLLVVPSEAVFGVKDTVTGRRGERRGAKALSDLRDLSPGDLVIHREHGIGVFDGMKEMLLDGRKAECLVLSYAAGDRLYLPVERSNLLEKFVSAGDGGPTRALDRLGSPAFAKRKKAAKGAVRDIAAKLKVLYARRLAATAEPLSPPDAEFREFEATFPYETTADQERAIEDVLEDVARDRPMDRLVCGDVGFGKTEVAIRAAYKAVLDGKQVAVLVPTTILAEQHRLTFAARFRGTPVVVESLSRFKSAQEAKRTLLSLSQGGVDVIIGTHRLLSKDVVFRDLGLLVVDEEHRFGVAHKERLREIAAHVHTLTLTATPIPRTLHMALAGIRDLSVIATPPRDRLAVKTFVARAGRDLVRSAVMKELNRNGQVFYVHNRVEDIYDTADRIQGLVPEARVTVAHGQMSADDLETVMSAFVRGDKDVLVCTTLIESGLDIGTANTMIVDSADTLGLAQLYQLRGRVGRAAEQAYCYLLVRDPSTLTEDARRRIEAIERFSELSSGFNLASMDLEIRGAGDVLGANQSGHLAAVGLDLFMEMLQDALHELSGEAVEERLDPELKIDAEARIPPEWLPDESLRLRMYKRLASSRDLAEVAHLSGEMADRFGHPPIGVERLLTLMRIKVRARDLGLALVGLRAGTAQVIAAGGHEASIPRIRAAAEARAFRVQSAEADRLRLVVPRGVEGDAALALLEDLLRVAAT
jgi:transcription-repair coupling factor (superfamily II helicase)